MFGEWISVRFKDGAHEHDGVVLTFEEIAGVAVGRPCPTGNEVMLFLRVDALRALKEALNRGDFLDRKQW